MKLPAACLALLIVLPSRSEPQPAPAPVFIDADAPKAIALVNQDAATTKADPNHTPLTILDVRTPGEFAISHLKNAKNFDYNSAAFKADLAKLDKSKPYLIHCAGGGRSTKARDLMKSLGFTNITHLNAGLRAWTKAGGPVVKPDPPAPAPTPAPAPVEPKK